MMVSLAMFSVVLLLVVVLLVVGVTGLGDVPVVRLLCLLSVGFVPLSSMKEKRRERKKENERGDTQEYLHAAVCCRCRFGCACFLWSGYTGIEKGTEKSRRVDAVLDSSYTLQPCGGTCVADGSAGPIVGSSGSDSIGDLIRPKSTPPVMTARKIATPDGPPQIHRPKIRFSVDANAMAEESRHGVDSISRYVHLRTCMHETLLPLAMTT